MYGWSSCFKVKVLKVFDKVPVFRWRCNLRSGRWRTDWSRTLQKRFSKLKDNLLLLCYDHMLLVIRQELFVLRRCVTATAAEADTFFTQSWWSFTMFTMDRCCCCSVNNLCRSMQLKAYVGTYPRLKNFWWQNYLCQVTTLEEEIEELRRKFEASKDSKNSRSSRSDNFGLHDEGRGSRCILYFTSLFFKY